MTLSVTLVNRVCKVTRTAVKMEGMLMLRFFTGVLLLSVMSAQDTGSPFEYSVIENSPDGTFVGNVGSDAEQSGELSTAVSSVLKYQLLSQGNPNAEYFAIEEDTGVLRTSKQVVRDSICPYLDICLLEVRVAVTDTAEFYVIFLITVDIIDFNNNAPEWPESTIERTIPENTPVGSSFSIPTAQDPDSAKFSIKRYELAEEIPQFELKVRNISGTIDLYLVLKVAVDREVTDSYMVKVIAYDGGVPPNTGILTVRVIIQDNNDNRPRFDREFYEVSILENAQTNTTVTQVKATDPDEGANGKVLYAFAQRTEETFGDVFRIDRESGLISLRTKLNYETTAKYNLFVTAQEQNPEFLPEEVRVIVNVGDVNDNPPAITVNSLTESGVAEVSESAPPGSFLAHITVADPDTGYNGQFQCDLENNSDDKFSLGHKFDNEFTLKTADRFDREMEDHYEVVFVCADKGSNPLTSSATITIKILDENDNYPTFSDNLYATELDENNPVGMFLMQFKATDLDAGANGLIEYTIHNSAQDFVNYDPESGNLTARVSFDYERFQSLTFQLTAQDQGSPPRSSSVTVLIKIRDLNDEAPEFLMPKYVFGVYEEKGRGELVGEVSAIDRDNEPNNEFIYSLKPSVGASDTFVIEPLSGKILTQRRLDREMEDNFNMVVIATDKHDPSLSSTVSVSVYVVDINDHAPIIDFPTTENNTVYISSRPSGQQLPRILAHDDDIEQNGKLRYSLESPDDTFIIDENTGQLYIQKDIHTLNRESFRLDILVQDHADVPMLARGTLVVVVNASADSAHDSALGSASIAGSNLVIVVVVAIVSAVVTLVLVAAIVYLKRQDTTLRRKKKSPEMQPVGQGLNNGGVESTAATGKKEVSFSHDVMEMEGGKTTYDPAEWKTPSKLDDKTYHQKHQTKPAQTKADKQWKVQQYLQSHIPPVEGDEESIHSAGADSGMGSNEEHHQPPSPDRHTTQGSGSSHPPIPPRAPIVPRSTGCLVHDPPPRSSAPSTAPRSVTPRSVTPSPYYSHRPAVAPQRSNSLQGRDDFSGSGYVAQRRNSRPDGEFPAGPVPTVTDAHFNPTRRDSNGYLSSGVGGSYTNKAPCNHSHNLNGGMGGRDVNPNPTTHVQLEDRVHTVRHASVV